MILLLDFGNSRLKWATASNSRLKPGGALEHRGDPARAIGKLRRFDVSAVWVSVVLGPTAEIEITAVIKSRFGVTPRFARSQRERAGLRIAYADPARLGVDRWLSMLALWTRRRKAFCVVNAGTALTFDAVDPRGRHRGGLIAPGLVTAQAAVLNSTRFSVRSRKPEYGQALGRDTESCVQQGALYACAGLIERAAGRSPGARIITGGDAVTLLPHLGKGWSIRPDLVLEGLLALSRQK